MNQKLRRNFIILSRNRRHRDSVIFRSSERATCQPALTHNACALDTRMP